jgi:hypothetical protein
MKKIITITLVMISFISCTENKKIISEKDINKFAKGSYLTPSKYGTLDLFILADNKEIIISNADYLKYVYDKNYQKEYTSYKDFLAEVLNQQNEIKKSVFERIPHKSFKIDNKIKGEYQKLNFNNFFNKHAKYDISSEKSNYLDIQENTSSDQIKTISYYFYLNGYQIVKGDNFPRYYIYKREKLMN